MGLQGNLLLWALETHRALPLPLLKRFLRQALDGACVALCLHRVKLGPGPLHGAPDMMIRESELDRLLELLVEAGAAEGPHPLLVSFDDGYADAAQYAISRHDRFPGVEWVFFVCPEKLAKRAGFRWDAQPESDAAAPPHDPARENERSELRGLADREDCRLLGVEECGELRRKSNVRLGNHTNCHFRQVDLPLAESRREIVGSRDAFEALFGKTEHFAFPFGAPQTEFGEEHVRLARDAGYAFLWSTESRPYAPDERVHGAVLPRFAVLGSWPATKYATYIAASAARFRLRRRWRRTPRAGAE